MCFHLTNSEAEGIVPAAISGGAEASGRVAAGDQAGALAPAFAAIEELRAEFEALERPEFTVSRVGIDG